MLSLQSPRAICQALGTRLRALRLARNVSQAELARMAGASLSSVRRLEAHGQGSLALVVQVALALQAAEALDALFAPLTRSIAQVEAAVLVSQRRRARNPAPVAGTRAKRGGPRD